MTDKKKIGKTAKAEGPITKDMTLGEVAHEYPEAVKVMFNHGLHCIGCHIAEWETVEQGAMAHGIDVKKLVDEMNKAINKAKR